MRGGFGDIGALEIGNANDPRRAFAVLARGERALHDQTADSCWTDGERFGRLVERRLAAFGAFSLAIDCDATMMA